MRFALCSFALLAACSASPQIETDASTSPEDAFSPSDDGSSSDSSTPADDAASAPDAGVAQCVQQFIGMASGAEPGNPGYSIFECSYRGATVYYVPPQCCDQFSALLDASCEPICAPDGGFTGDGDGRCTDFDQSTCTLLWRDPRGP